ncbi:MAG: SRPBCC domain-containing protein [Pseudomonadota bacterium]
MIESGSEPIVQSGTTVARTSDREVVVTRTFEAPARLVFAAWTTPELFMRWWAPKSMGMQLRSCEMDVRTGGSYRLAFGQDASSSWEFFGKYLEVIPGARLVWTNDEGEEGPVTTVTFDEKDGKTLLTYRELYPSKQALDEGAGAEVMPEQFEQLDAVLAGHGVGAGGQ